MISGLCTDLWRDKFFSSSISLPYVFRGRLKWGEMTLQRWVMYTISSIVKQWHLISPFKITPPYSLHLWTAQIHNGSTAKKKKKNTFIWLIVASIEIPHKPQSSVGTPLPLSDFLLSQINKIWKDSSFITSSHLKTFVKLGLNSKTVCLASTFLSNPFLN